MGHRESGIKPFWWDRNYTILNASFRSTSVAPHAVTTRATVTPTVNQLGLIQMAQITVIRITAAAPVDRVTALLRCGGSTTSLMAKIFTNNVGDRASQNVGQGFITNNANLAVFTTEDLSTGGTVDYDMGLTAAIFDIQ